MKNGNENKFSSIVKFLSARTRREKTFVEEFNLVHEGIPSSLETQEDSSGVNFNALRSYYLLSPAAAKRQIYVLLELC